MSTARSTDMMKNRIISHMNADHAESLSLYLRHYSAVPNPTSAELTDITLEYMIIESSAGRNLIKFSPPMKNFSEARERMVAMHQDSLRSLGLSDIKINHFALPNRSWQWGLFFLCLWCYITFPFPDRLKSRNFMAYGWSLGYNLPFLTNLASTLGPRILPAMLVVHAVESGHIWWSRLRKHGLDLDNPTTWLWISSTFVSGFGTINRFDELVGERAVML